MFSKITSKLHGESNALYKTRDELKKQGHVLLDLISGNINEQGYIFPQDLLEDILIRGMKECRIYRPDSFGQIRAREAVAEYYAAANHSISPNRILITPGTSISYWYCFKLLADEGDEILCPCPSYPLFDYIALVSGIKLIPYRLDEKRDWAIDPEELEACISTRTRAIALISPHNPTGRVVTAEEIKSLAEIARRHDLAIISDEVFSEFLFSEGALPRPMSSQAPLIFTLNGFSKMFALPGIKFGWMAVSGDEDKTREAMRSLELIADTFLPVNEIVQAGAADIFACGKEFGTQFSASIRQCWETADAMLKSSAAFSYAKPAGGFYAAIRLQDLEESAAAEELLRTNHLLLHPGYFYDMKPNHLIICFAQKIDAIRNLIPGMIKTIESLSQDRGRL